MRKKEIGILTSISISVFALCGCGEDSIKLGAESQWIAEDTDVFSFDLVEATSSQITTILINHSTETLCWGSYFALEKNVDGVWYELEVQLPEDTKMSWNSMQYTLDGEEEREIGYNLELFGELPEGEYRIVKEFSFEYPMEESWVAACEFVIDE